MAGTGVNQHTMRTCRRAPIGIVPKLMDMYAALGIGVVAGDVVGDGSKVMLGVLLERYCSPDIRVSSEHGDCGRDQHAHAYTGPKIQLGGSFRSSRLGAGWGEMQGRQLTCFDHFDGLVMLG